MKNAFFKITGLVFFFFFALSVRPAHANFTVGNTSFVRSPAGNANYPPGNVPPINLPGENASNPGGYFATPGPSGFRVSSPYQVTVYKPPGVGVPAVTQASAALLAGTTIAAAAQFEPTVANPAAVLSAASTFLMAGGTATAPFNPPVGAGLMAAGLLLQGGLQTCNIVGCAFLNGIQQQGLTLNPDGSVFNAGTASSYHLSALPNYIGSTPAAACQNPGAICVTAARAFVHGVFVAPNLCTVPNSGTCVNYQNITIVSDAVAAPATNADVVGAIQAASASATVQADIVNLALNNGMSMIAASVAAQNAVVASAFTQQSTSIDSLGNTVSLLARDVATVSAGPDALATPSVSTIRQTVQLVNTTPTSVTNSAPVIITPNGTVTGTTTNQATTDLCAVHPNIEACADVSNPAAVTDEPLSTRDINLSITPVSVGPSDAVCPAPFTIHIPNSTLSATVDGSKWLCEACRLMKPLNIAFAWLGAGFIVMGGLRKGA